MFFLTAASHEPTSYEDHFHMSCTVIAGPYQGTGTFIINGDRLFVITNAHVAEGVQKVEKTEKGPKFVYDKVILKKQMVGGGKICGHTIIYGHVVRYNIEEDICIIDCGFASCCPQIKGAKFANFDYVPKIASPLFAVGSPGGDPNSNSFFSGYVSAVGKLQKWGDKTFLFDQFVGPVQPGVSGTGLFNDKKEFVGIISQFMQMPVTRESNFGYFIPVRRIWEFAHRNDCLWIFGKETVPSHIMVITEGPLPEIPEEIVPVPEHAEVMPQADEDILPEPNILPKD